MASGENSKADSRTTNELKSLDHQSLQNALASIPWNQPPLSSLTSQQQTQLQNQAEVRQYRLGEKNWSTTASGYQFFISTGKVRLREEKQGKPLVTLQTGDWFGDLYDQAVDYKAVAASKEVIIVRWNTTLWAEYSTPQIAECWRLPPENQEKNQTPEIYKTPETSPVVTSPYPFISHGN